MASTATTAHGKSGVIQLDDSAGSLTDLSSDNVEFSHDRSVDIDDDTAKGERAKGHTIGPEDPGQIDAQWICTTTVLRHMAGIWGGTATQTCELNPAGTGTGRRKKTVETLMNSIEVTISNGVTTRMSTGHKATGAIAYADN